jgi:hypothetical protein
MISIASLSARTIRLLTLVLAAISLLVPGLLAEPVGAHDAETGVKAVFDGVFPAIEGIDVRMEHSLVIQLVAENRTTTPLQVIAATGEPFLQIGPDGVLANVASESWFQSSHPDGGPVPDGFVAGGEPKWVMVAAGRSWAWFDHRMHPGEVEEDGLFSWVVPLRWGDQTIEARGHWEERHPTGGFGARVASGQQPFPQATVTMAFQGRLPGLSLQNDSTEPITVLGAAGEPFARVGPAGSEVNLHSPTWLATAQSQGYDVASLFLDASAPPEWFFVGPDRTFFWLEGRGLYTDAEPPSGTSTQAPSTLVDWSVSLQRGAETATVRAVTEWIPAVTDATSTSSWSSRVVAAVVGSLIAIAGVVALLRHRRRTARSAPPIR